MALNPRIPMPIHSLRELGELPEQQLPIERLATTYTMAQDICWVDVEHFAVARWDGSLSIFNKTDSMSQGATITTAVSTPADAGVQMVDWIAPQTFITSNDASSMVVWKSTDGDFQTIEVIQTLSYDPSLGVANDADATVVDGVLYVMTGHENGYLTIWSGATDGSGLELVRTVDLRTAHPVNPWNLQNIRGVEWLMTDAGGARVVTGSENGEVCVVAVPGGQILSRTLFNPDAKRGINAISLAGQNLLVANCSVGSADKNLWYYWIDGDDWSLALKQSVNLIVDASRPQVFNFDVSWGIADSEIVFFSATEEGVLWMGTLQPGMRISVTGYEPVAVADLGAALASGVGYLAYVAYDIASFDTTAAGLPSDLNPNRVDRAAASIQ